MALEPARVITKVRAPDFLFLHNKDFWFKQIWVDLHQTMVLDRQGSYTRPVIGLVRCVCKDETDHTGRTSPIKMRICNLHFFAPVWMAQPIVHNFRRMSMADLKPRFFCCERLSASMARSLRLELYLYTAVDSRPGPGGNRTTASCQS